MCVAVILSAVIGLAVAFSLLSSPGNDQVFVDRLSQATLQLATGYGQPVRQAALESETLCPYVKPDPALSGCAAYVQALSRANSGLVSAIDQFKSLPDYIPEDAPQGLAQSLNGLIDALQLTHDGNRLLIDAWRDLDAAKWTEGWEMRIRADAELSSLLDETRRIAEGLP